MAVGEKRLFSLINATVSHDMRNPTNSILMQTQEQKVLNNKLEQVIVDFDNKPMKKIKKSIQTIHERQQKVASVQMSAVKILMFLVSDMLDYSQITAGQFRKMYSSFNVLNTINEVMDIMRFKADELGVKLITNIQNLPTVSPNTIINENDQNKYVIKFDQ